jgi:hypothetical protein
LYYLDKPLLVSVPSLPHLIGLESVVLPPEAMFASSS